MRPNTPQVRALGRAAATGRQARARGFSAEPRFPPTRGQSLRVRSPRNLRVSVGWSPSGLPLPRTQLGAPEPGGGAAGARGASASALGAGGPVPRARGRGAGAPGRRVGEGRGRDGRKEGGRGGGGGGRLQRPRTLRASHTCTGRSRAARRRPVPRSLLPPSSRSVAPALPARLRRRARGRAHDRRPREASARASRAGYVDCPARAGPRDQHSPARGPGGQRGL